MTLLFFMLFSNVFFWQLCRCLSDITPYLDAHNHRPCSCSNTAYCPSPRTGDKFCLSLENTLRYPAWVILAADFGRENCAIAWIVIKAAFGQVFTFGFPTVRYDWSNVIGCSLALGDTVVGFRGFSARMTSPVLLLTPILFVIVCFTMIFVIQGLLVSESCR